MFHRSPARSNLKQPGLKFAPALRPQKSLRWYVAFAVLTTVAEACFVATTLPL